MAKLRFGIVICSRVESKRLPGKAIRILHDKPVINHLIDRIYPVSANGIGIIVAVPPNDICYKYILDHRKCKLFYGSPDNCLHRTLLAAQEFELDAVIRITHDKILIDHQSILHAVEQFEEKNADYLLTPDLPSGSNFEIISTDLLADAYEKTKSIDVEHISYAVRNYAKNTIFLNYTKFSKAARFLIDYPEDLEFMRCLLKPNPKMGLHEALAELRSKPWLTKINKLPVVTIYTSVYNQEKHIGRCIDSVLMQDVFRSKSAEYIIIDDGSTDRTFDMICQSKHFDDIKVIRRSENFGLANCSNKALSKARGKWILRLDSDDWFVHPMSLGSLLKFAENNQYDAIYPHYFCAKTGVVIFGDRFHHVGGSIFKTSAMHYLKFTDKLRGYEGLDFFNRAIGFLNIGYYHNDDPIFYYSYSPNSLSNRDSPERRKIFEALCAGKTGEQLLC